MDVNPKELQTAEVQPGMLHLIIKGHRGPVNDVKRPDQKRQRRKSKIKAWSR